MCSQPLMALSDAFETSAITPLLGGKQTFHLTSLVEIKLEDRVPSFATLCLGSAQTSREGRPEDRLAVTPVLCTFEHLTKIIWFLRMIRTSRVRLGNNRKLRPIYYRASPPPTRGKHLSLLKLSQS